MDSLEIDHHALARANHVYQILLNYRDLLTDPRNSPRCRQLYAEWSALPQPIKDAVEEQVKALKNKKKSATVEIDNAS